MPCALDDECAPIRDLAHQNVDEVITEYERVIEDQKKEVEVLQQKLELVCYDHAKEIKELKAKLFSKTQLLTVHHKTITSLTDQVEKHRRAIKLLRDSWNLIEQIELEDWTEEQVHLDASQHTSHSSTNISSNESTAGSKEIDDMDLDRMTTTKRTSTDIDLQLEPARPDGVTPYDLWDTVRKTWIRFTPIGEKMWDHEEGMFGPPTLRTA